MHSNSAAFLFYEPDGTPVGFPGSRRLKFPMHLHYIDRDGIWEMQKKNDLIKKQKDREKL